MLSFLKIKTINTAILVVILILAAGLRFYNLNWDQNQHLHPDERFLTMVAAEIDWPKTLAEYFSTATSPLNPFIQGYPFFVYGTLPLFLTKALAEIFGLTDYNSFTIFGRGLSAFFDLLTVLFVYLLASKSFGKPVAIIAAFLYSLAVLGIQQAHFFTVDSFLNFFMTATIYFLIRLPFSANLISLLLGASSFGLALASKASAVLLGPGLALIFGLLLLRHRIKGFTYPLIFLVISFLVFRTAQPYAFSGPGFFNITLNQDFTKSIADLQAMSGPESFYPPSVQWHSTPPLTYPFQNLILWGLGLPMGILTIMALLTSITLLVSKIPRSFKAFYQLDQNYFAHLLLATLVLTVFIYQGIQFAKPLRYLLPLVPPLAILGANYIYSEHRLLTGRARKKFIDLTFYFFFFTLLVWPLAFTTIYSRPHSRVMASEWIYQHIPPGSKILTEYWDDSLPLTLDGTRHSQIYQEEQLPLFDPESPEKWIKITGQLEAADYIILSSGRVWSQVPKLPERYPTTIVYYQRLFDGQLGYSQIAQFTSYPTFLGFSAVDDSAEENFTVFDHPKVMVFKKTIDLPASDLLATLHQTTVTAD